MTSVYIISALIIIACITVCVLFIRQSVEKKRKEQARLLKALEKRAVELVQMIDAFPPQFLPKDITVLIYRCLIDTYQQLTSLDNKDEHVSAYKMYCAGMENIATQEQAARRVSLENPQQIVQIKQYLNYLAKLLSKLSAKGSIDKQQHSQYHSQLKKLIHQISVDNYMIASRQAQQSGNARLALHNAKMAQKILTEDGVLAQEKQQIDHTQQLINDLSLSVEAAKPESSENAEATPMSEDTSQTDKKWDAFKEKDSDWKKNNVYD